MRRNFVAIAATGWTLVVGVTGTAHGQAAGQWKSPEHVYTKICANCHDTGVGPVIKGRGLHPELFVQIARRGQRAMPGFRVTDIDDEMLRKLGEYLSASPAPGARP